MSRDFILLSTVSISEESTTTAEEASTNDDTENNDQNSKKDNTSSPNSQTNYPAKRFKKDFTHGFIK